MSGRLNALVSLSRGSRAAGNSAYWAATIEEDAPTFALDGAVEVGGNLPNIVYAAASKEFLVERDPADGGGQGPPR